jgi:hypothetical protein
LKTNRLRVSQLQADRNAASMTLSLAPGEGAGPAELALDGGPPRQLEISSNPRVYSVSRGAELHIPSWGRVELRRGTSTSDLDQIEDDLRKCDEEFAEAVAPFGIAAGDPDALDRLLARNAEHGLKKAELQKKEGEFKKLAPKGLEPLRRKVIELETKLKAAAQAPAGEEPLPGGREALETLKASLHEIEQKYNTIKGRLESSEGLHAERAALSARVDELTRLTAMESLEKDSVDRLYELFEECREKQLGALMGPIHDRVLNWMRVLDIGDYHEVRFSDALLSDRLVRRDGTAELEISEESTGAQEQIDMLVRLALGSLLASAEEPAVAILDNPLTHCDVGRPAEGDANLSPPAGPLQIIILTCHPEWFRDERATVIDLEDVNVMQRFAV